MLRSTKDFVALQGASRRRANPLLILRWRRNDQDRNRFGLSTGRRIGNAVVRNRVRRRLRDSLRRTDRRPDGGWDLLVVARPASASASYEELKTALDRLLDRMVKDEGDGPR
ncbi:MAG: ribonuclease P protein component [Candidatus Limnocylindrales bacterium]